MEQGNREERINRPNMRMEEDESTIDVVKLIRGILNHWLIIILITVLAGGAGFGVSKYVLIPEYASTAQLYVLSKSTSITSLADIQTGTNLTYDYIAVATDRPILDRVIKNLDLDMDYKQLNSMITVSNPDDSRLLNITVQSKDPKEAKKIADEMADVTADFIAEKMDQDPPSVISYSYSDGNPVSPNVKRNTVLAAAAGFLLALVIAIIRTLVNDLIETPADVENKLNIYLLGTLPYEKDITGRKGSRRRKKD